MRNAEMILCLVSLVGSSFAFAFQSGYSLQQRLQPHKSNSAAAGAAAADDTTLEDSDSVVRRSPILDDDDDDNAPSSLHTSAVLKVTYDGGHFSGWTASNDNDVSANGQAHVDSDGEQDISKDDEYEYSSRPNGAAFLPPLNSQRRAESGRKRRRGKRIPGITQVRSVEGQIRKALAKVYGDVDPKRIQIEGCSRTDKGVHGKSMIALLYCLTKEAARELEAQRNSDEANNEDSIVSEKAAPAPSECIPGKRIPHPSSPSDDSSFEYLPFNGNIDKLMFVLNRMLPPDVRVINVSPMPQKPAEEIPFHPTLDAREKTYKYTFSIGHIHDPMRWRHVWHVDTYGKPFDFDRAGECAKLFAGSHNFTAFRGAFRGSERGRVQQNTICNLSGVHFEREVEDTVDCVGDSPVDGVFVGGNFDEATENGLEPLTTYTVTIVGDRFLYKMVRFLVGSIVAVGLGKLPIEAVEDALRKGVWEEDGGKGKKDVICAPSHGLVLDDVKFEEGIEFDWRV
mmetsp:Transcript_33900/g.73488  ORF Transcript_33900/g.73488 Transcript_33900/m.73488 type:complete len:510 (-) Transcript_33900:15-1544(-)